MNKALIERLVEKRAALNLPAARELNGEEEVRWWANVLGDELYAARGFWNGESYDWLRNGDPE